MINPSLQMPEQVQGDSACGPDLPHQLHQLQVASAACVTRLQKSELHVRGTMETQ